MKVDMDTVSINQIRDNLETFIEQSINGLIHVKVTDVQERLLQ